MCSARPKSTQCAPQKARVHSVYVSTSRRARMLCVHARVAWFPRGEHAMPAPLSANMSQIPIAVRFQSPLAPHAKINAVACADCTCGLNEGHRMR